MGCFEDKSVAPGRKKLMDPEIITVGCVRCTEGFYDVFSSNCQT